jgi:tRNA(Ile)-lysidine synthase TilS/MesJ
MCQCEGEILDLLHDADCELDKAESRIEKAQQDAEQARANIDTIRTTLRLYRQKHGLPDTDELPLDSDTITRYQHRSVRQMIEQWTEDHRGEFLVRDAAHWLADAGLFRSRREASSTLHATVGRVEGLQKVDRGTYRRLSAGPTTGGRG